MELIDLGTIEDRDSGFTRFLSELCDSLEVEHASYCAINTFSNSVEGFATYRDDWKLHYAENQLQLVDPTIRMSSRSIAPVDWGRFKQDENFSSVFNDASDFGVPSKGLTVPIRGPFGECGLLSVSRDCSDTEWQKLSRHIVSDLQMAAVTMHDAVMQSDALAVVLRRPNLSQRECEILQWTAAGKSQMDIAEILTISSRTVEVHLRSARSKLAALTTAQAVGRGIAMGFIDPR